MKKVKTFAVTLLGAALVLGFAACGEKEKAPKGTEITIEIENKEVKLPLGESIALKVKVTPESEASKVVWTSSKPEVAVVDNQGKVSAIAVGETEVKAAIGDKSAICRVTVPPKEGEDTEVTIEIEEKIIKLPIGESVALKVKVTPESEASRVVWTSLNPEVATVDDQGKVTAKASGETNIKASIGDNSATCKAVVAVNISEKLGITGKPFALNEEICLQYVWDYKTNKEIIYKGDKPAIIDFWAEWCGPCRQMAPFLDKLATEFDGKAYVFKAELGGNGTPLKEGFPIFSATRKAPNNPGIENGIPAFLLLPADGSAPKAVIGSGPQAEATLRKFFEEEVAKAQ